MTYIPAIFDTAQFDYSYFTVLYFTSGQTALSKSLDYNNGVITSARLKATIASGSFNFYLSADGGVNWESVTNNVAYPFVNTGSDLRWKITENAASSGEITNVEVVDYK